MTSPEDAPLTGPIQTITRGPRQRSLVALGAAIIGSTLTVVGFSTWILAALDGSGSSAGFGIGQVLFFVGVALGILAIVLAVWSLVRGVRRVLPIGAIVVAVMPAVWFVGIVLALRVG